MRRKFFMTFLMALLSLAVLPASAADKAKNVSLKCKDIRLTDALRQVERQSEYYKINYNHTELENYKVTATIKDKPAPVAVEILLNRLPLSSTVNGKFINIGPRQIAQQGPNNGITVKGHVSDTKGEPLPGVTVKVKGKSIGTFTDVNGHFTLNAVTPGSTIEFSYVGMKPLTRKATTKQLEVILDEDANVINDVVVTGYANIRKNSFTGSAVQVSREQILKVSTNNLISALQVFDPSMRVTKNVSMGSDPNSMPEFYIRGQSGIGTTELDQAASSSSSSRFSLLNNPNLPIFIMDGFEVSVEKVYDYDINRIKNVTILKDAAATAMYGSRASNGVIVIETVPPAAGKLRVSYNANVAITAPDLSSYNMMNAQEALAAEKAAGLYDYDPFDQMSYVTQWQTKTQYYNQKANLIARGVDNYWLAQPLRTDVNQTHSVSLDAGGENVRFSVDLRYNNQNGVMKGSYRDSYTGGFTLDYLVKHFQFRNNFTFTLNRSEDSPYGSFSDYTCRHPYDRWADDSGELVTTLNMWGGLGTTIGNPIYKATLGSYSKSGYKDFTNNTSINWFITNELQIKAQFALNFKLSDTDKFTDPLDPMYTSGTDMFKHGDKSVSNSELWGWNFNLFAAYNRSVKKHNINASLGINLKEDNSYYESAAYRGFPDADRNSIAFANDIVSKPSSSDNKTRLMGTFATLNYSYNDIYLSDLSFRADGSSEFGSERKWGPFWSAGVGLNIHNYAAIKKQHILTLLRVKATYGQTGKVNFAPYVARNTFEINTNKWYPTGISATLKAMGNPELTWEKTHTLDFGLDAGILRDVLNIHFNWYNRKTIDLITDIALPASSGFSSYKSNGGKIQNRGWEFTVNTKVFANKDWDIRLFANMAHNSNKILELSKELQAYNDRVDEFYKGYRDANANQALTNLLTQTDYNKQYSRPVMKYEVGSSLTAIYGMKSLGINPADGEEIFVKRDGTITRDWSTYEQQKIGDTAPKVNGSFGINLSWKQFALYTSFMYEMGGDKYNQTLVDNVENVNLLRYNADRRVMTERWTNPGDVTPLKSLKDRYFVTRATSRFIQKDNTLTFNSVSLSYDLDHAIARKFGCQMLRLQFNMNDLAYLSTIKREMGLDYPFARTFTFTLSTIF